MEKIEMDLDSPSLAYSAIEGSDKKLWLSKVEAAEEVRIVVANILRYHPQPFHVTSKEAFY
jgi:hypothetical protein